MSATQCLNMCSVEGYLLFLSCAVDGFSRYSAIIHGNRHGLSLSVKKMIALLIRTISIGVVQRYCKFTPKNRTQVKSVVPECNDLN